MVEKEDSSGGGKGCELSHCIGEIPDWSNFLAGKDEVVRPIYIVYVALYLSIQVI